MMMIYRIDFRFLSFKYWVPKYISKCKEKSFMISG